jgi:primosomal protein N' (replication factor Y)
MNHKTIIEIAVPTPLRKSFDYLLPASAMHSIPKAGMRVQIPFGKQQLTGIILKIKKDASINNDKLKPITAILDETPIVSAPMMALIQWASDYYQHPIGECFATALPNLLRKGQALLAETSLYWKLNSSNNEAATIKNAKKQIAVIEYLTAHGSFSDKDKKSLGFNPATLKALHEKELIMPFNQLATIKAPIIHPSPLTLNKEQATLINSFKQRSDNYECILLEGITGSGKTEVYLQLIAQTLQAGKQALILVPEIGLTPQTIRRFEQRFECPMAIFHSNLSDKQRLHYWQQARSGTARIIIGTRSALFTATQNLGIIIVDEEHDLSYKQQDGLRYSARDLACVRAKLENIPIVLGSATPTLESLYNASLGKYTHWQLTQRAGNATTPTTLTLDIRHQTMLDGIADAAIKSIEECLQREEQALIFINRRGFAPSLICHDCGWVGQCHACDSRMTIHLRANHLRCHHCLATEPIPYQCPQCKSRDLVYTGAGTERIEQSLQQLFPQTTIFRIDRDTTHKKNAMADIVENIQQEKSAILVGTQMLAKGHHFPNVTLVVVLDADGALMGTDYRAIERFGQLLTQVTGRAGREEKPGTALIQTHYPHHQQLHKLLMHGYHRFAMDLLAERQQLQLPPFSFQALIRLEDQDAVAAQNTLRQLQQHIPANTCQSLGPYPANLQRRAHFYRYQLLLQSPHRAALKHAVSAIIAASDGIIKNHKQRWSIDIDPQDMS